MTAGGTWTAGATGRAIPPLLRAVPFLLLLLISLCLGGCRDNSERTDICSRALETLLDAAPTDFTVAASAGDDGRLNLVLTARGGRASHQGACDFAPVEHPGDRPALRGLVLDGVPLPPMRLIMLSAAVGVPVDLGELADSGPVTVPPGRAFPYFIQEVLNGLVLGAVLALVAVGYSLV